MGTSTDVLESLHPGIQGWLREQGWHDLTPIQKVAAPVILGGEHCLVEAPTAGGKTEAVLFPALTRVAEASVPGVRILYLAPLRALLNDLELRAQRYASACGLRAFKWHGDVSQRSKIDSFNDPPEVLLTTPESTEAILLRKAGWERFFRALQVIVIDEAHSFAFGDRGHHLLSLLERLEARVGHRSQRVAITATVGNPAAMARWLVPTHATGARRLSVQGTAPDRDFSIRLFDEAGDAPEDPSRPSARVQRFGYLTGELRGRRSIVFVRSRKGAEDLAKAFLRASRGPTALRVRTHHSAVSRYFREEAEALIKEASESGLDAILSTSTLELGIDIGALDMVVQLDALSSPSAFLQRIGRTGRRPGSPQRFRGLCLNVDDLLLVAATVSLGLEGKSEALRFRSKAFHILAHQTLCLALQENGVTQAAAWETLRGAACFADITVLEHRQLVEHMIQEEYLRRDGELLLAGEAAERRYLGAGWRRLFAVFDTAPLYEVIHGESQVGTLDAGFVEGLALPFNFILAGRPWTATSVDPKSRVVRAKPTRNADPPRWLSYGGMDVPPETARRAGEILSGLYSAPALGPAATRAIRDEIDHALPWRPGSILVVRHASEVLLRTFAGDQINRTLARLLETEGLTGTTANYREVRVARRGNNLDEVLPSLAEVTSRLTKPRSASDYLVTSLETSLRRFAFSPFAACLPDHFFVAALADERMDVVGLSELLQASNIREVLAAEEARPANTGPKL